MGRKKRKERIKERESKESQGRRRHVWSLRMGDIHSFLPLLKNTAQFPLCLELPLTYNLVKHRNRIKLVTSILSHQITVN
jgi:hypothetical protein